MWYVNYIPIKLNLSPPADRTPQRFRQLCRSDLRLRKMGPSLVLSTYFVPSALCRVVTRERVFRTLRVNTSLNFAAWYLTLIPELSMCHTPSALCNHYDIPVRHI